MHQIASLVHQFFKIFLPFQGGTSPLKLPPTSRKRDGLRYRAISPPLSTYPGVAPESKVNNKVKVLKAGCKCKKQSSCGCRRANPTRYCGINCKCIGLFESSWGRFAERTLDITTGAPDEIPLLDYIDQMVNEVEGTVDDYDSDSDIDLEATDSDVQYTTA